MGASQSTPDSASAEFTRRFRALKQQLLSDKLVDSMQRLLAVLLAVDAVNTLEAEGLYHSDILNEALRRYETIWLPLLVKATAEGTAHQLQPPVDVLFIWYVHRIHPVAYKRDWEAALAQHYKRTHAEAEAAKASGSSSGGGSSGKSGNSRSSSSSSSRGLGGKPHEALPPWKLYMSSTLLQMHEKQVQCTEQLWAHQAEEVSSDPSWNFKEGWVEPYMPLYFTKRECRQLPAGQAYSPSSGCISCDIVASAVRQKDFITNIFNNFILKNLILARKRYAAFVCLDTAMAAANGTEGSEKLLLVPTYDIDLAWHAHMMNPQQYQSAMFQYTGKEFDHDDSYHPTDPSKAAERDAGFGQTEQLWHEHAFKLHPRVGRLNCNPGVMFKGTSSGPRALQAYMHNLLPPELRDHCCSFINSKAAYPARNVTHQGFSQDAIWSLGAPAAPNRGRSNYSSSNSSWDTTYTTTASAAAACAYAWATAGHYQAGCACGSSFGAGYAGDAACGNGGGGWGDYGGGWGGDSGACDGGGCGGGGSGGGCGGGGCGGGGGGGGD